MRIAYAVPSKLSEAESGIYRAVTGYVREEFNRAEALKNDKRAGTVGFALTILQQRLASSPDDVAVGGRRGREALGRLRNVVGRVESSWRPACAEEGFEIVRHRLFEPLSEPSQWLDGEVPNLGKSSACRRVARTISLGSAPTATAAHRGLEDRRVKLGCVLPGESPAIFGDALRRLAGDATYLYPDGPRYRYSTQPTVTKLAEDRAEHLRRDPDKSRTLVEGEARATGTSGAGPAPASPSPGPGAPQPATPGAAAAAPTRLHGTVTLDAARVGRDAGRIAEEVIVHLAGLVGAKVTVTLEVEALIPTGDSERVVRAVTVNSRTLKFTSQSFELG